MDIKLFNAINDDMKAALIALQDEVTDFNEGSVISALLLAVASEIEECYLAFDNGFKNHSESLIKSLFGFTKQQGSYAVVQLTFSISKAFSQDIIIPAGSRIGGPEPAVYFSTKEPALIKKGLLTSEGVEAIANILGTKANLPANSLTKFIDNVPYVESVTNSLPASGGNNEESDEAYNERFKLFIRGLGSATSGAILNAVKALEGVKTAKIVEHFPPVEIYNFTIYVDDGSGAPSQELLDKVFLVINGNGTAEYSGYKAAGVAFRVLPPAVKPLTLTILTLYEELASTESLTNTITTAAMNYVNNLNMGESLIISQLISKCMATGVINLSVENYQSGEVIEASDNEVLRLSQLTVAQGLG